MIQETTLTGWPSSLRRYFPSEDYPVGADLEYSVPFTGGPSTSSEGVASSTVVDPALKDLQDSLDKSPSHHCEDVGESRC